MELPLIPAPQKLDVKDDVIMLNKPIAVVLETDDEEDRFAAEYLCQCLAADGVEAAIGDVGAETIGLTIARGSGPAEGYTLSVGDDGASISGSDAAGVYYAAQTLRQSITPSPHGPLLPHLAIQDAPRLAYRAMHYDTKHHQDTYEYVQDFIRELAHYKANVLVWEWEDRLAYKTHPQIGAPGAFTMDQMQELTRFAKKHHVQIVPLVQGLGHVAFILKHKEFRALREIPDSDWEFCPLKDGSYELLFELWRDAMEATPGSEFMHIGSDETYELGLGEECGCRAKAEEIGKDGLMAIFISRCVEFVESQGRKCLSWGGQWKPGSEHTPSPKMIWTDGGDPDYVKRSAEAGFPCWIYAPNTGIVPLIVFMLPWQKRSMWHDGPGGSRKGGFFDTMDSISRAAALGAVEGSITTSWDDSGLHNQMWMPRFVCAAEYSWNPSGVELDEWIDRFYLNYFGPKSTSMRECQMLLQDGAQFYEDTFQRRVWHWGDVGKIHIPDFPRDGLEYHPFWKKRYGALLQRTADEKVKMQRAISILEANMAAGVKRSYDVDVMLTCARLMMHNIELIQMLADLEDTLGQASYVLHFKDRKGALAELRRMEGLIEDHLADREKVYSDLVTCWEKTRLVKGGPVDGREYFWKRERARHFANRTPDMRYLVMDEDLLDLEGYLGRLKAYNDNYEKTELDV